MDLAWVSLAALLIVIVVSCFTSVNPGVLAITFACLIGVYLAPMSMYGAKWTQEQGIKEVVKGFPADLFLTLTGVTLLFTQAQVNGTLHRIAGSAVKLCRGNVGLVPIMFFLLTAGLSTVGAGNIASAAFIAPLAMSVGHRAGVPPFLMTIMVAHGSLAGALSEFAPTGIVANTLMAKELGLTDCAAQVFGYNLGANAFVALAGYLVFGGWKLFSRRYDDAVPVAPTLDLLPEEAGDVDTGTGMEPRHWYTLAVIAILIGAVLIGGPKRINIGLAAFACSALLTVTRLADENKAVRTMPWGVIVMVCGVSVLTSLLERTGGIDRFAEIISKVATVHTLPAVMAFMTGVVSVYSSTSGVVLPAFIPVVPKLLTQLGGNDPLGVTLSIIVGGHLVDSSPLSTIGALCIASIPLGEDRRVLFNKVLIWGLSMSIVGAGICHVLFAK